MSEFTLGLGDRVRDRITGLRGIVVARTDWLNFCNRYTVQPERLKDGKPIQSSVFDEGDLVVVKKAAFTGRVAKVAPARRYTGGPPTCGADPIR